MSSGSGNTSGLRWPDLVVAVGCVFLITALGWVAFPPATRDLNARSYAVPNQLREIHQAMLFYGFDNNNYFPGLNPDGSLLTNDATERYELLLDGGYTSIRNLVSPADVRPDALVESRYSYAILDIASPGARRDAWTTEAVPDAPILAESPAALGKPEAWSGWVLWHSPYLTAESAARSVEQVESSRLNTSYSEELPFNLDDDLFVAESPDDAYLIEAEQ